MAWCTSVTYSLSSPPASAGRSEASESGHPVRRNKIPRFREGSYTLRCYAKSSRLLHHRVGIFPDARIDEIVERHWLLVRLDGADLLHQAGGGFELVAWKTVVLGRPKLDVEEGFQGIFIHFLAVAGVGCDLRDRVSVFRILHETCRFDHARNRTYKGVAVGLHVVLACDQHEVMAGRVGVFHGQQDIELLALSFDLREIIEMQHGIVQTASDECRSGARTECDLLHVLDLHTGAA